MTLEIDGVKSRELEKTLSDLSTQITLAKDAPISPKLEEIREALTAMLVAFREIENIEKLHRMGNLLSEIYLDRRKKLLTDYYTK